MKEESRTTAKVFILSNTNSEIVKTELMEASEEVSG